MAEYQNRERDWNNGLGGVIAKFARGCVLAHNEACDAYLERMLALFEDPANADFQAETSLIGLDEPLRTKVSVPKVSLMPPMALGVREAELTMDMTVAAHSEDATAVNLGVEAEGEASLPLGPISARVRVKASLSVSHEKKRHSDYSSTTHARLVMGPIDPPEGMMKIIDALNATTVRALEVNEKLIDHRVGLLNAKVETDGPPADPPSA